MTSLIGVHIIKATEKTGGVSQPLEIVRDSIADLLQQEFADARASSLALAMAAEINTAADMDVAALKRGYEAQQTLFVSPGEPILGLGFSAQVTTQAFQLAPGQVAGPIDTPTGPAFVTVVDIQPPSVPPLDEVESRVRDDVVRKKALVAAQQRAAEVATLLQTAEDFTQAAEAEDLDVIPSEFIARGGAVPGIGPERGGGGSGLLAVGRRDQRPGADRKTAPSSSTSTNGKRPPPRTFRRTARRCAVR